MWTSRAAFTFASSNAISQYGLVITNLDGEVIDVVPGGEGNLGYDFRILPVPVSSGA